MLKLKQIIAQLPQSDFEKITDSFKKTKADNYHLLLNAYREDKLPDGEIINLRKITRINVQIFKM